jgi:hypothetical protein
MCKTIDNPLVWILQKKVEEAFETRARGSTTINIMFNMLNLLGKWYSLMEKIEN